MCTHGSKGWTGMNRNDNHQRQIMQHTMRLWTVEQFGGYKSFSLQITSSQPNTPERWHPRKKQMPDTPFLYANRYKTCAQRRAASLEAWGLDHHRWQGSLAKKYHLRRTRAMIELALYYCHYECLNRKWQASRWELCNLIELLASRLSQPRTLIPDFSFQVGRAWKAEEKKDRR